MISITAFKGKTPKISPKLIGVNFAQIARNCDLKSGNLKATRAPVTALTVGGAAYRTIYKYGDQWLYWPQDVDVVKSLVFVDTDKQKIYFTGSGYPKQITKDLMPGAGYPDATANCRRLGISPPATPLTLDLDGPETGAIVDDVSYTYTLLAQWPDGSEEESAPAPPTASVNLRAGQYASVAGFTAPSFAQTGNNVTHFRLYRLESGFKSAAFQLVTARPGVKTAAAVMDIPVSQVPHAAVKVFDVNAAATDLSTPTGITLRTTGWLPPVDELKGLTPFVNGVLCGFRKNEIWFSEPFIPYAWPEEYRLTVSHDVVGLGVSGEFIVVGTKARPYLIGGSDPAHLTQSVLPYNQACLSKRGMIGTRYGVLYPSPDGLFLFDGSSGKIITGNTFTKAQWQAMGPDKLISAFYDDKYYGFFADTSVAVIIDFAGDGDVTDADLPRSVKGLYSDPEDDTLYLLTQQGSCYIDAFESGSALNQYQWKSKVFETLPVNFQFGKIAGAQSGSSPVTVKLYADGVLKLTKAVSNTAPFLLPAGFMAKTWEVELGGSCDIDSVHLMTGAKG